MCGRFARFSDIEILESAIAVPLESGTGHADHASYNIAPTQDVLAVIREGKGYHLTKLHWGLVPFWAEEKSTGSRMINARAETVSKKPAFRAAFNRRRCLIPADGFFEWKKLEDQEKKQPYFCRLQSEKPFLFAGIWEEWENSDSGEILRSCAIITTEASDSIKEIHNRMPAILPAETHEKWMDSETDTEILKKILEEQIIRRLEFFPVSTKVNKVKNNSSDCLKPLNKTQSVSR